jgi:prepilin-type N-terminal cleavage/methylation domain-containing protein
MNMKKFQNKRGFTLIEMMVAVALFAIVMLIAGATLLSLVYANRKAQALQSVMNNLNISLDDMVRSIREGSNYRCGGEASSYGDCTAGGSLIYFTPFGFSADDQPVHDWAYVYDTGGTYCGKGRICENEKGTGWVPITSPEVQIQNMVFYVVGTKPASAGGTAQAKVIFTIKGQAGAQASTQTTFDIQATAVQRLLNL